MARRPYGEGSVYPTGDGSGWMADLSIMLPNGKRKRVRRRAKNKTEARRLLRAMRTELSPGGAPGGVPPSQRRTVAMAVAHYLEVRHAQDLQPRTLAKDRRQAEMIIAGLGSRRVASLSVDDCDGFLRDAANGTFGAPLGRPELRRLRQKLVRVIENDERRGFVARNVASLAVIPDESPDRILRRQPRAITLEEIERLIAAVPEPMNVFVDLIGRNGLRPAEARGLRWNRIDLTKATIRIDAQMNRDNELAKAKTKRSYRTIRVDDQTLSRLGAWQETQSTWHTAASVAWTTLPEPLLISTHFGTPISQRNAHRSIVVGCKKAKISPSISAYDLRHSAITLQVERGHPVHKIADWAGTSERMISDVYRHKLDAISDLSIETLHQKSSSKT